MRTASFKVKSLKTIFLVLLTLCHLQAHPQSIPLSNAFAHNDYFHDRPLFDALDNGYTYIEADVFLKDDELIVAHINPYFKDRKTLENLYLKPLAERITKNGGQVYKGYAAQLTLMIDIKTDADRTYNALKLLLQKYRSIFTVYDNGKVSNGPVIAVISGNKPYRAIEAEKTRLAFIDADLRDLSNAKGLYIYTMASCKYSKLMKWTGRGIIPRDEKARLKTYVEQAHRDGRKVRLWASPESKVVWRELLNCGVDLINTDKLTMLKDFLKDNEKLYAQNR